MGRSADRGYERDSVGLQGCAAGAAARREAGSTHAERSTVEAAAASQEGGAEEAVAEANETAPAADAAPADNAVQADADKE